MATLLPRTLVPDSEPVSERSYGIIPIRLITAAVDPSCSPQPQLSTANTQVLLIKQKTLAHDHPPFWSFPKGHPEHGDKSSIDTAIREVQEETGILVSDAGILFREADGLKEKYRNPVRGWVKEVQYWVGLVGGQGEADVTIQEAELVDARWLDWKEAMGLITFDKGKELLARVMGLLDGEGEDLANGKISGHL